MSEGDLAEAPTDRSIGIARFAVKAVEHAQVSTTPNLDPQAALLIQFKDVLGPPRESPTETAEALEVSASVSLPLQKFCPEQHRRLDDEIYDHVISEFPELVENEHEKLIKLDEDWLKSEDGKKRWRAFINASVHTIPDLIT